MRPAFIATIHDPDGRYLEHARNSGLALASYAASYFRVTPSTDERLLEILAAFGSVSIGEANQIGQSRRAVLRQARADGFETIIYCDFDRWLHWAARHADELAGLPAAIQRAHPDRWYVCLGRTRRAFTTHPRVQCQTEAHSNHVISLLTGDDLDATAGACWLTAPAADIILAESVEASNATDLEWPALIAVRDRALVGCLRLEGLEFETATFYGSEIDAAGGRDAWLAATYERPEVWESRQKLMTESIRAALRVFDAAAMNGLSCE